MKIPSRCKIYSINEGYTQYWDESVKQYIHKCKYPDVSVGWRFHCLTIFIVCLLLFVYPGGKVGFKCSLCWFHGGRHAPYIEIWWHIHIPCYHQKSFRKGDLFYVHDAIMLLDCLWLAEAAVRVQPDGIHY